MTPELYSSLTRLKMAQRGTLPPMTAIPADVAEVIDPDLTIGLGALAEDEDLGLRCPVRGCGIYGHRLTRHFNAAHWRIGGADGIKRLLQIPQRCVLVSNSARLHRSANSKPRNVSPEARARSVEALSRGRKSPRQRSQSPKYLLMGYRNLKNRCEAQTKHDLVDLQQTLGRSPSSSEARAKIGETYYKELIRLYGSWIAVLSNFGLDFQLRGRRKALSKKLTREAVLNSLEAYHDRHGEFPSYRHAVRPTHGPLIPSRSAILNGLGTYSWDEAMRRAAALLGIHGGKHGLPEKSAS